MTDYFVQAFIYLCAAVIAVPLAKRLGLGSVLGYLIAGVIIGPVTGLVGSETQTIQHFAEFGVVMMLFLVGLELQPAMLWQMRHRLLGLGGLQVSLTATIIMAISWSMGLSWQVALAIGLVLALSSTAIVLQTFSEKGLSKSEGGRAAFSVLLFQDIAVIPMLAFIPLLAVGVTEVAAGHAHHATALDTLPTWAQPLGILAAIGVVVVGGHFLTRPLFRMISTTGLREMFSAAALMVVIGIAALMSLVGLSPALGTFLAGVVMANSEFRHELEADLEPFKGLLLGLFFITVGAGIDFSVIHQHLWVIVSATAGLMLIKGGILFCLARLFDVREKDGWLLALSLAQAGEFGFVLLAFCLQVNVIPASIVQVLSPVVALSMFLTPLLFIAWDKLVARAYHEVGDSEREAEDMHHGDVIIVGIGRFGQIVNRLLLANGVNTVVLDHSIGLLERVSKINVKAYYGDASRADLLHAAGIDGCRLLVIAMDDRAKTTEMVWQVKRMKPELPIVARAYDRGHLYELQEAGADHIMLETIYSALEAGRQTLEALGMHPFRAELQKQAYIDALKQQHQPLYEAWQQAESERFGETYLKLLIEMEKSLGETLQRNLYDSHDLGERGWTPPPMGYADKGTNPGSSQTPQSPEQAGE